MAVWLGFLLLVAFMLALDLGLLNRRAHVIGTREALRWTTLWVGISLLFSVFIYYAYEMNWFGIGVDVGHPSKGLNAALTYLTGYIVELSLSMDNIFVIAVIFTYFGIPKQYQHRVLFWGILGAVIFRGIFIAAGAYLISHFDWVLYVFGAILLWTAYKMVKPGGDGDVHPDDNLVLRLFSKFLPVTKKIRGEQFFIRREGKIIAMTPVFVALIVIETTDIMFAFDSIPAIFAITTDPFIVFTSNIFAILGLRSMYFVLASMIDRFEYLKYSLATILAFVGIKMLVFHPLDIKLEQWISLTIILVILLAGIGISLLRRRTKGKAPLRGVQADEMIEASEVLEDKDLQR